MHSNLFSKRKKVLLCLFSYIIFKFFLLIFLPPVPKQEDYKATKLHFKNLADRYGNPIIVLDLTKVFNTHDD